MPSRKKQLLQTHPELASLPSHDPQTKYIVLFLVAAQTAFAMAAPHLPTPAWLCLIYFAGAPLSQALFLGMHECAHNLSSKSPSVNRRVGIAANLPLVFPAFVSFRTYHMWHHMHQDEEGKDMDLPSRWEAEHVTKWYAKLVWLSTQLLAYAIRPILLKPIGVTAHALENCAWQVVFDLVLYLLAGKEAFVYLLVSMLVSGGMHPCAGHFISEHYDVSGGKSKEQTTFSYYGPLNRITWNVGYHNEHHDLPQVPWSSLPKVKRIAPEFYDLKTCPSWTRALIRFVTDPDVGPAHRVVVKKRLE